MSPSAAVVVLFYRYFLPTSPSSVEKSDVIAKPVTVASTGSGVDEATFQFFQAHASFYLPLLQKDQQDLCQRLSNSVKGRILISQEGINGTLSYPSAKELSDYIQEMEAFDLIGNLGLPGTNDKSDIPKAGGGRLFINIDWKTSTVIDHKNSCGDGNTEPFPDLKIQVVKEIVNTGGTIHAKDIPKDSGKEISAREFHQILMKAQQGDGGMKASREGDTDAKNSDGKESCEACCGDNPSNEEKEVVLIDVRNTFEHSIGHFLHPHSNSIALDDSSGTARDSQNASHNADESNSESSKNKTPAPALNPNTVTFSHFDSNFCARYSDSLKDKKVLMYCTGGIRCVKASAMLKQRGVEDVSHLSGGIHRYVEQYGSEGFYKGKVFVFDQRVALDPNSMISKNDDNEIKDHNQETTSSCATEKVVGNCIECQQSYDQISGATICTVCRDLILLCPTCKSSLDEFHCDRHQPWKKIYFTFLERFSLHELHYQHEEMQKMHDTIYVRGKQHKNVRRTLQKQIDKILARIKDLEEGKAVVEKNAKKRCRTCFDSEDVCDGLCWGFWRSLQSPHQSGNNDEKLEPILPVKVGDRVTPGSNWNALRNGSRYITAPESFPPKKKRMVTKTDCQPESNSSNENTRKVGTVVEVKPWASGGNEMDCVAVSWDVDPNISARSPKGRRKRKSEGSHNENKDDTALGQSGIYRWGAIARNGKRMYDVEVVS